MASSSSSSSSCTQKTFFCFLPTLVAIYAILAGITYYHRSQYGDQNENVKAGSIQMFDVIAEQYDVFNRYASMGRDNKWRAVLVDNLEIKPDDRILDLATGTADVALIEAQQLAKVGGQGKGQVVGVDASVGMLAVGKKKLEEEEWSNVAHLVELKEGDVKDLVDVADGSFDKISMSFGMRNVDDRPKALKEILRVSKKSNDTVIAIMEASLSSSSILRTLTRSTIYNNILNFMAGLISAISMSKFKYPTNYLNKSITDFPAPEHFVQMMEENGLSVKEVKNMDSGVIWLFIAHPRLAEQNSQ